MTFTWKMLFFMCIMAAGEATHTRVLLGDIQTLTLKSGESTAGRRSSPIPQLNCVGGNGRTLAHRKGALPSVVQCQNQGSDGTDIQWACTAELDAAFRLGVTDVACEGYEYPNDPYVLTGSCGLEFTIELTPEGHQLSRQTTSSSGPSVGGIVFLVGLVLLCGCLGGDGTRSTRNSGPGFWSGAAVGSWAASSGRSYRSSGYGGGGGRSYRSTGFGGTRRR